MPSSKKKPQSQLKESVISENQHSSAGNTRSSVARMLDILDLFTPTTTKVQVDEVGQLLGVGRSTSYRYFQELCDSGLLVQQGKGWYTLGSRVIELEQLLQLSDPLLNAGKTVMADMMDICQNRTLLLCTLFKDRVLCIHQVGPDHIVHNNEKMPIYRGRGSALPLFQGAGSQVILAHLVPHQIRSMYLSRQDEITAAGLGTSWKEFRTNLTTIRKQGFVTTVGKLNPRVLALAVPINNYAGQITGSLLLLCNNTIAEKEHVLALIPRLKGECQRISELELDFIRRQDLVVDSKLF